MTLIKKPRILAIDDEQDMTLLYKNILKNDYKLITASSGQEALKMINNENFDLILLDIMMPEMNGIEVLRKIKEQDPALDVIMITASKDVRPAIESLKLGAFDYLIKPFEIEDMKSTINKALERKEILLENLYLKQTLDERASYGELIGKSDAIKRIYDLITGAAKSNSTIFITGESGTGKEIVAETIHKKSSRGNKPYVIVNCAAIPDNLLESEMFGHERGAFTGALERHIGKFELASGGTIFLDEIGEMPLSMQAKLLRVIQEGTMERVGGERTIEIDVRIIAATNIDIKKAIKEKLFREDLFYRLNVIPIFMPALRERIEDLPLFIEYFIPKYNKELNRNIRGLSKEALAALANYSWPGNVRELENLIERMMTLSGSDILDIGDVPRDIIHSADAAKEELGYSDGNLIKAVNMFEKELIIKALKATKGNQTAAAKILGLHRTTLISKMDAYGVKFS
jgi:two-component system response regulator AtoC